MAASFRFVVPPADLAPWVDGFWLVRARGPASSEVVLPNGAVELIFSFGGEQRVLPIRGVGAIHRFHQAFVAGFQRGPLRIGDDGVADLLGVRFRLGGAFPWLRLPMKTLTDRVEPVDALDGGSTWRALHQWLGEIDDDAARLALVVQFLRARLDRTAIDRRVAHSLDVLRTAERGRVGALASRLGLSHKHVDHLFATHVGVTPRTVLQVARFHAVVGALQRVRRPTSWAALSAELGYADQAHLARAVRRFAGVTPTTLARERSPDGWHLLSDEDHDR